MISTQRCFALFLCLYLVGFSILYVLLTFTWLIKPCPYNLRPIPDEIHGFIPKRIAFGSCMENNEPQDLLDRIHADAYIFLGDNVYADTVYNLFEPFATLLYNQLSCKPPFQRLVNRIPYVMATWDDHDYGKNDGGEENPVRYAARDLFLGFWRIPADSQRRKNPQGGIYGAYRFSKGNQSVLIVMLDLRFNREPLRFCSSPLESGYCPTNGTMLGQEQWAWLETLLLHTPPASFTVIASSTQFSAEEYGYETWANFPLDRDRLARMLNPNRTVVVSGDLHWGEISLSKEGIFDITSSGISALDTDIKSNRFRVGPPLVEFNYGVLDLESMTATVQGFNNKISVRMDTVHNLSLATSLASA